MEQLTHYQILEVDQKASQAEIRKKYLELAFMYHPDRYFNVSKDQYLENEYKFKLITRAFQVLSDSDQRSKYDLQLKLKCYSKNSNQSSSSSSPVFCAYKNGSYSFNVSPVILEFANKLFSNQRVQNVKDFFTIFGQFTANSNINENDVNLPEIIRNYKLFYQKKEDERKTGTQLARKPRKIPETKSNIPPPNTYQPKASTDKVNPDKVNPDKDRDTLENPSVKTSEDDLIYTANVSLSDIYMNVKKILNVPRKRVCHHCLGVGYLGFGSDMSLCQICKGLMIISDSKIFPIDIKKRKIVFENEGNQRLKYLPGDLIIHVQPKPHPTFTIINQYDLNYIHNITLIELYQYLEIQIQHLDCKTYNIIYEPKDPNVLKDKCLLKIKEKGLLMDDEGNRGDLYIQLNVEYPNLTREQFIKIKKILISDSDTTFTTSDADRPKSDESMLNVLMATLPDK